MHEIFRFRIDILKKHFYNTNNYHFYGWINAETQNIKKRRKEK